MSGLQWIKETSMSLSKSDRWQIREWFATNTNLDVTTESQDCRARPVGRL
jgi:hypothetical protein